MPSAARAFDAGSRTGRRRLREIADELRERRLALGLSQHAVASAARLSRSRYSRVESALIETLGILELARIAAVVGLELGARLFPGGAPIRDAGQVGRLSTLTHAIRQPLTYRLEVPVTENPWDARAWDAVLYGDGERTAIELEMRLRDMQAMHRRHALKRRDDPVEHFLLAVADTKGNRRLLDDLGEDAFELPRLRRSSVLGALGAGRHPETGVVLL